MTEREQMLMSVLDCRRVDLFVDPKRLTPSQEDFFQRMKSRRDTGEPLQYIIGHCEFMGIKIFIDPRVLIPRPETELLTAIAIERLEKCSPRKPLRILDLGTGSGNIAIALAKNIENGRILTVDICPRALELAKENARFNGVDHKVDFYCEDMISFLQRRPDTNAPFDLIISNPPYVAHAKISQLPADVRQEPWLALDGGEDGLNFYRTIIAGAYRLLADNGFLCMEIGDGQADAIQKIFEDHPCHPYDRICFKEDNTMTKRIVIAQRKDLPWINS